MTVRDSFAQHFGEENALRVEEASVGHINDPGAQEVHADDQWGTDPFRYHLMNCISHDCFTTFAAFHGFTDLTVEEVRAWAVEHADLHEMDGDIPDYLGLFAGAYHPWMNWARMGQERPAWSLTAEANIERFKDLPLDQLIAELKALADVGTRLLNEHEREEK
jgi:hypothetical protein